METAVLDTPGPLGEVIIGVDTHKYLHVACALDDQGRKLGTLTISADQGGHAQLLEWAEGLGRPTVFGVEGTGSYGAPLTSFLRRKGHHVVEVTRPDRRMRRMNGKSDTLDAENAARAVLSGAATATPRAVDGSSEAVRLLKAAHDTAVKARTQAMITLKCLLVHADDQLRDSLRGRTQGAIANHLAVIDADDLPDSPSQALLTALKSLAQRWKTLDREAKQLREAIAALVEQACPQLLEHFGIGADTAAEALIVIGDDPARVKSEAAFAKLAGIAPLPTGSGLTSGRHRVNHGGHRQLNAAVYRVVIVRLQHHQPTIDYMRRRTAEGLSKRDVIRCLKRYVIREIHNALRPRPQPVPQS